MTYRKRNRYVVFDVETTGEDPTKDQLLEVGAVVLAEGSWLPVAEFSSLVLPGNGSSAALEEALNSMPPVVAAMHSANGLVADLRASLRADNACSMLAPAVDRQLANFLRKNACLPGEVILTGSSVGQFDKGIAARYLPHFHWLCSYRVMDLSSVRRMAKLAGHKLPDFKPYPHRALGDCLMDAEDFRALLSLLQPSA